MACGYEYSSDAESDPANTIIIIITLNCCPVSLYGAYGPDLTAVSTLGSVGQSTPVYCRSGNFSDVKTLANLAIDSFSLKFKSLIR